MENEFGFCKIEQCASAKAYEIKFQQKINMEKAHAALKETIFSFTHVVILCKLDGKPVSLYASGRAMIKNADEKEAQAIANKLMAILKEAME